MHTQNEAMTSKGGYHGDDVRDDVRERSTAKHAGCIGLASLLQLSVIVCLFCLFCLPPCLAPCFASERDPWWGQDKALHFSAAALVASDGYAVASLVSQDEVIRASAGSMLSLAVGAAKEIYDGVGGGDPSLRDLTWDVVGAATGTALSWLIDRVLF